jgi:DNA-binding transcriptional ArsR family regulator
MTKGTLSHHFSVLKGADLITAERRGQQIVYSLNTTMFEDVATVLLDLFGARSTLDSKAQASAEPAADGGTQNAVPESKRR